MASSTTKPVEMVNAISDRLSRLNPATYMIASVPTSDSGTESEGISVADRLRRNRKITATTSTTASASSNSTSETEARIVLVRSVSTVISTACGNVACSEGSSEVMLSTTEITLAPGWRWTLTMTAGVVFIQPASLVFSSSLIAAATSDRCTGEPFLYAMTRPA